MSFDRAIYRNDLLPIMGCWSRTSNRNMVADISALHCGSNGRLDYIWLAKRESVAAGMKSIESWV